MATQECNFVRTYVLRGVLRYTEYIQEKVSKCVYDQSSYLLYMSAHPDASIFSPGNRQNKED